MRYRLLPHRLSGPSPRSCTCSPWAGCGRLLPEVDDRLCRLSESGPPSSHGGEWLWSAVAPVAPIVPRAPGLIWVHGPWAGDVMVDGSSRGERLRPLVLRMTTALGRVSQQPRELTGRLGAIWEMVGLGGSGRGAGWSGGQVIGSSASGPSSASVWKQRRASFLAIVSDARGCESPRALSAR